MFGFSWQELWRIKIKDLPWWQRGAIKFIRIVATAVRRFSSNRNQLRASALTYYSLLSVVPVLAALFGVAQGLGVGELLREQLTVRFSEHTEVLSFAIDFADRMLQQTRGGLIAGVGLVLLLWSVIKALGHIESALNAIWNIRTPRSFVRRVANYIALLIILPALVALGSGITVYLIQHAEAYTPPFIVRLMPYMVTWTLFMILYMAVPNTNVPFAAALFGGVVAGTAYSLWQWLYIEFQIGVSTYGAIYGSFAALPLFLIWLQVSWMIVLSGAEICYASQYVDAWEFKNEVGKISSRYQKVLGLYVLHYVYAHFVKEGKAVSPVRLSDDLEIPVSLTRKLISALVEAGLLIEAIGPTYVPGRPPTRFSLYDALHALETYGTEGIPVRPSATLDKIKEWVDSVDTQASQNAPELINLSAFE